MKKEPVSPESEQTLMKFIFKYRDAVQHGKYLPIGERERDRKEINRIYEEMHTLHQKILDSKCYLEMGKLQKNLSDQFLLEDTTPQQRLGMLAYLLRSLCFPILFVSGNVNYLSPCRLEKKHECVKVLAELSISSSNEEGKFQTSQMPPQAIDKIRAELKNFSLKTKTLSQWKKKISLKQAQVLSQMVANGEIEITVNIDSSLKSGQVMSVVLKESS